MPATVAVAILVSIQVLRGVPPSRLRLCGRESAEVYGGAWRNRIQRGPREKDLVKRVLAEVAVMAGEGTIRVDAGAAARDLFQRWGGGK